MGNLEGPIMGNTTQLLNNVALQSNRYLKASNTIRYSGAETLVGYSSTSNIVPLSGGLYPMMINYEGIVRVNACIKTSHDNSIGGVAVYAVGGEFYDANYAGGRLVLSGATTGDMVYHTFTRDFYVRKNTLIVWKVIADSYEPGTYISGMNICYDFETNKNLISDSVI